jgi:hypothetical protein
MYLLFFFTHRLLKKLRFIFLAVVIINICSCEKVLELKEPSITSAAVFEDVWQVLDKKYALFSIKNINWDSLYIQSRPQFTGELNNNDLFKRISNILEVLKDGHVSLISSEKIYTYDNFYTLYLRNFNFINIEKNYLKNQYNKTGPVIYKIVDSIGYLYYSSFRDNISEEDLNIIFNTMTATKGLIVDVRDNGGGTLSNAEKLFSRFINSRKLVKYEVNKKGPAHNDFLDKEAFYISPSGNYYSKKIVLLTNRTCFSACNDFAMYMTYLPNVTLVGDQTGGGGSVPANYLLLNGWKLQYSSSVTLSPDNLPVENGVKPDIPMIISPFQEANGIDPILEKAYQLLK